MSKARRFCAGCRWKCPRLNPARRAERPKSCFKATDSFGFLSSELNGPAPENSDLASLARRVSLQERRRRNHLRGQGQQPARPRAFLFSGRRRRQRQDRIAAARSRRPRLHRRGQREGSAGPREQPDQAEETALQHPSARRQDVPVHQTDDRRAVSARLSDAPVAPRRIALLWPVLSDQPGLSDRGPHPPALSDSLVQARPESQLSATVLAVLHWTLPGAVRGRAHHARALRRSGTRREDVPRRPGGRSLAILVAAYGSRSRAPAV